ncbi:MAG: RNase adapter RapZ [Planktomarina sp.]
MDAMTIHDQIQIVLVAGPSGSGRSTAIDALEDAGFLAINNLPLTFIPRLLEGEVPATSLALGIDATQDDFSVVVLRKIISDLQNTFGAAVQFLLLECAKDVLIKRYSETRRKHPNAYARTLSEGVDTELQALGELRRQADVVIDTSNLSPHDLRFEMEKWFAPNPETRMHVHIHSFSYKRGIPMGLDTVFDCRFLKNPHWDPNLRPLDGRNGLVQDFVATDNRFAEFSQKVLELLDLTLPAHVEEGKSHVSIGFGCSGGKHRSVTLAEMVFKALDNKNWRVTIHHRELSDKVGT